MRESPTARIRRTRASLPLACHPPATIAGPCPDTGRVPYPRRLRHPLRRLALVTSVIGLCLIAACGSSAQVQVGGGALHSPQRAPHLSGTTLDGAPLDLTRMYAGKVVVVNFYASWCAPCRAETPLLVRAAKANAADGVQFAGVLFKDSATNGRSFRSTFSVGWPSLVDTDGAFLAGFKGVNASAIPDTFVLNRAGQVAARWIGGVQDETEFNQVVHQLAIAPSA